MAYQRRVLARSRSGRLNVIEESVPQPQAGEILVEVEASLVSAGTELSGVRPPAPGEPAAAGDGESWRSFGYQNAGRVIAVGEGVTQFAPGERVACMGAGYAVHGTVACVPVNLAVHLPQNVSYEEGAFVALAATALNAVRRAEVVLGEFALVMGLGLVGQLTAQLCQLAGVHVMGSDRFEMRRQIALANGMEQAVGPEDALVDAARQFTRGYGMDAAFLCFGGDGTEAFRQIVSVMKRAPDTHVYGRVVIPGGATVTHAFGASLGNLDIRSAARTGPGYHDRAYEVGGDYPPVYVPWTTKRHLEELVLWISKGRLNVRSLITHRVSLEEAPQACYELVRSPQNALGLVIVMK